MGERRSVEQIGIINVKMNFRSSKIINNFIVKCPLHRGYIDILYIVDYYRLYRLSPY